MTRRGLAVVGALLSLAAGADGVHLGQEDLTVKDARAVVDAFGDAPVAL